MTVTYVNNAQKLDNKTKLFANATIFWLKFIYPCLMFWFCTTSPSENLKPPSSPAAALLIHLINWSFCDIRWPCFPSVALAGRLNDTRRMTGNYLTIKREPRTIDPRKCDARKGRRTFAKLPGMIDESLQLHLALIHNKHFSENQLGGAADWRAFRHVLYIIHERRIKRRTPALLWPFTNMKSQINLSTNHGSVFQLLPAS